MKFAEVVVGLPVDGPFTYSIPPQLQEQAAVGKRAWVSFSGRVIVGYIVGLCDEANFKNINPVRNRDKTGEAKVSNGIKPIQSIIDKEPIIAEDLLKTTKWMSEYYFCSWGEALEAVIPPGLKKGRTTFRRASSAQAHRQAADTEPTEHFAPTEEQAGIINALGHDIAHNIHRTYLLHGVTGSGKTEVYLQAISFALKHNRASIVLVPEISLTPQAIERFMSRFGREVAVLHSRLTAGQRFFEWKKIKEGSAKIAVGARSAVFAPMSNLGLIVIDEEHETSYKQQDAPRYHAREVAIKRAGLTGGVVILGSATPSLESYYLAGKGVYKLANLTRRIKERKMPSVQIIDMRQYLRGKKTSDIFSKPLRDCVRAVLDRKEQAMLFLNRRGFSTFAYCKKCGHVIKCKNCDIALTYHFENKKLNCHWCNLSQDRPLVCPACGGGYVTYAGMGTEKVESEMHRIFSGANIARMDTDATARRGSHKEILDRFKDGHTSLLVGTQMIAKGHDFPEVTLVGVVSADVALHVPDFRSGERTFNLLTQVAGRAGRGEKQGRVLVQTYTPQHYAIVAATKHDYTDFYNKEILHRKYLALPPFTHIVLVTLRGRKHGDVAGSAAKLAGLLQEMSKGAGKKEGVNVAGPAVASIPRLRGEYRWNVILKVKRAEDAASLLRQALKRYKRTSGVKLAVDVDPL